MCFNSVEFQKVLWGAQLPRPFADPACEADCNRMLGLEVLAPCFVRGKRTNKERGKNWVL